jgi:hypothetical protein
MRTGVGGAGKAPRVWVVGPLLDEFDEEMVRRGGRDGTFTQRTQITVLPWTTRENGITRRVDGGLFGERYVNSTRASDVHSNCLPQQRSKAAPERDCSITGSPLVCLPISYGAGSLRGIARP